VKLAGLLRQDFRRSRRAFVLSAISIAVGIASLAFFLSLGGGVRAVAEKVFPVGQLEVQPSSSSGLLGLGGPAPLTDEIVDKLKARPEVKAAYRRMRLAFPARAFGGHEIIGHDIHAELIAEGLDPAAVEDPKFAVDDESRPVPAVLSPFLLEIYNGAIAPSHHLPHIGSFLASRFRGFVFGAELGVSFFGGPPPSVPPETKLMTLVGIAPHAARLALTLPLEVVRRWNVKFAGAQAGQRYSSVLLELKEGADVARLAAAVRELGFTVDDAGAERVGILLSLLTLLFALVSFAVIAVAAIDIAHGFYRAVAERKREIGVLRAVGASAADVQRLFLVEAAIVGAAGGALGLVVARLGALAVDAAARKLLPDFPFRPDSWFAFDWRIAAIALLCAVVACTTGALFPARAAAKMDPAEALTTT
jgi:hypothetical protein